MLFQRSLFIVLASLFFVSACSVEGVRRPKTSVENAKFESKDLPDVKLAAPVLTGAEPPSFQKSAFANSSPPAVHLPPHIVNNKAQKIESSPSLALPDPTLADPRKHLNNHY
jgi:hypothetical protein